MPSRVPLTNLRDKNKGGAPDFAGADRLTGETLPSGPTFADDDDPYLTNTNRRGLLKIAHIPPAGASTVDFVTLFLRNTSLVQRAYVNVLLASNISIQLRISGVLTATPVYADMLLVEDDHENALLTASIDDATNELSIASPTNLNFDTSLPPRIEFDPPVAGNLSAAIALSDAGVPQITVFNPTSHSYSSPPTVRLVGGITRPIGFFESFDEETIVRAGAAAGRLTAIGTTLRSQFANNTTVGDAVIVNNELRVVRSVNTDTKELTVDAPLTGASTEFETWSFLPLLSASTTSQYRIGNGRISNKPSLGHVGIICSLPHNLCTGDYVIYRYGTAGTWLSNRVATIVSDTEFTVHATTALSPSESAEWYFVYLLAESEPAATTVQNEVRSITYVKTPYGDENAPAVVNTLGLGGRRLFLRNTNFMNQPGSYYDESIDPIARAVQFCQLAMSLQTRTEVPNDIDPSTVLELELKTQPTPEVQVLSGFPVNGGLSTDTGRRPLVAVYERGTQTVSSRVFFWGYYMRYTPESTTNYTQAINI